MLCESSPHYQSGLCSLFLSICNYGAFFGDFNGDGVKMKSEKKGTAFAIKAQGSPHTAF